MAESMVRALDVHKRFGRLEVLRGVDMDVARGEVVVPGGPGGSREKNGRLVEDREPEVARKRAAIGMVFQRFNLFPHLSALGNVVEAPLRVKKLPRREA